MTKKHVSYIRISCAALLLASFLTQALPVKQAYAGQISDRSLTLLSGADGPDAGSDPDGGSQPGGNANHQFTFTLPTAGDVGSIRFQYCTTAGPVQNGVGCITPAGLDVSSVTLGSESGVTGFNGMDKQNEDDDGTTLTPTVNSVIITRTAANVTANTVVTIRLDNVLNPSAAETFFVRISSYETTDGTLEATDAGTVAAATSTQIDLRGTMPESLVFCAGETVELTGGVPDCSSVTTGLVNFDALFSPTDTATATSQMAASTNATTGYAITVNGPTLSSNSNQITPMDDGLGGPESLILGTSQFGMNLILNTTTFNNLPVPAQLGTNIFPASNATNWWGAPTTSYGTDDMFRFATGDVVAESTAGTDAQIYTVGYVVNVPGSQPAGTYTTTLTYVCTPTF